MTKEELVSALKDLASDKDGDPEANHARADMLLLEFIDDDDVLAAFDAITKWYS